MEKEESKLLPCPFCGGIPNIIRIGNEHTKKRSVEVKCPICYTIQKTGAIRFSLDWCENVAVEKWNKRV
jgi:Restriction alleviation protein Lar